MCGRRLEFEKMTLWPIRADPVCVGDRIGLRAEMPVVGRRKKW